MITQRILRNKLSVTILLAGFALSGTAWSNDGAPGGPVESGGFDVSWFSMDGGGGLGATGSGFELSGTVGQPDAGTLIGSGFTLTGGFWAIDSPVVTPAGPADCDQDGDVDLFDYARFLDCTTGPNVEVSPECECFDFDGDDDVDLLDFEFFQTAYTGG